jgi:cytochrome c oxidase cbb3-type subunit III
MIDYAASDFVSEYWHYYIAALSILGIIFALWVLKSQTTAKLAQGEKAEVLHHAWDGDLQELNNPLPRWWMWLFYGLTFFGIVYLALYPGLGKFGGILNWSSAGEWQAEKDAVDAEFNKVFAPFKGKDLATLAADPTATGMGKNLYMTYCIQCHGSDATGAAGKFPNLTDAHWLFGGSADEIKASIADGRMGEMPGGLAGDEQGAKEVAHYVLSLGGKPHDVAMAAVGKDKYAACAGCHGDDGKGMPAASFPNIVDDAWLYGSSVAAITETIVKGRTGGMPAQMANLGEDKVTLLTAYIMSLSKK